jgi:hypothetical protein
MNDEDDVEPDAKGPVCAFCSSTGDCPHLLLVVDQTFRCAEGGPLMAAFNERWAQCCDEGGEDVDERELLYSLLDEVDGLCNHSMEYDFDGGPGRFSAYVAYYVRSEDRLASAVAAFAGRELE